MLVGGSSGHVRRSGGQGTSLGQVVAHAIHLAQLTSQLFVAQPNGALIATGPGIGGACRGLGTHLQGRKVVLLPPEEEGKGEGRKEMEGEAGLPMELRSQVHHSHGTLGR